MEQSIWQRFKVFIQQVVREKIKAFKIFIWESLTQKFKAFFPGCVMGLFGAKSLLFSGLPAEAITFGAYLLKFMGTVLMAFGSGLGTSGGAYLIEKYKNRKNDKPQKKRERSKRDKAA